MPQDMGPSRAPRIFGILSIVFASLVLLGGLFGLLGLIVPVMVAHAPPPRSPEDARAMEFISRMYLGMGLISAILSVMSALLLALGIGQMRYRKWAATWSVRWGVAGVGCVVVMAILCATTFGRSLADVVQLGGDAQAVAPVAARQVGTAFGAIYAAMIVFFYAPYPILLMVFFSRPRVRAVMTA
jgi:hypothetical protein